MAIYVVVRHRSPFLPVPHGPLALLTLPLVAYINFIILPFVLTYWMMQGVYHLVRAWQR